MSDNKNILLAAVNSRFIHTNTAVYYLHRILDLDGIKSHVKNFSINDDRHDILNEIFKLDPQIVCFSCYIWNITMIYDLCSSIRQIDPSIKIVLGGPEVTYEPQDALQASGADLIIRGEGEEVISEAVKSLLNNKQPNCIGCYFHHNDKIIDTGIAITKNLADIPTPYTEYMMSRESGKLIYYEASRGCPFNCIYCLSSATTGVRYFPLDRVFNELNVIMGYLPETVKFTDRSFNTDEERTLKILQFLKVADTKTCFHLEIFPAGLTVKVMDALMDMPIGRVQLEAGIQSVNITTLKASGRVQDPDRALSNMKKMITSSNMHVHLDLIAGLPYEDAESFRESFERTIESAPHMLQLGFLKLLKGTAARDVKGYSYEQTPPYEVLETPWLSFRELCEIKQIEKCLELFYNTGRFSKYLHHMHKNDGSAYQFYKNLAQYAADTGISMSGISRDNKYALLASFAKNDIVAIECLRYDFMSSYRSKSIPDCLGAGAFSKEKIFSLLKDEDIRSKYFACNQTDPAKKLFKMCNFSSFIFSSKEEIFLFKYSERDLVTGLFQVFSLPI